MRRIIVIGLDGATWDLLKPWADNGDLPAIKKLINQGVWGNLKSTIPPITGPAWVSFSTGVNPGKHGFFDFISIKEGKLSVRKSVDMKYPTFYDILSYNNISNIITSLPYSYPPKKFFKGIMISDFLYPYISIYPQSKERYLKNYNILPNIFKNKKQRLNEIIITSKKQIQTSKNLFLNEYWQLYFLWFGGIDKICHYFWKEIKVLNDLGKKAKTLFKIADDFISWILSKMKKEDMLFIVSDHGFHTIKYSINLNHILKKKGLLKTIIKLNNPLLDDYLHHSIFNKNEILNRTKIQISKIFMKIMKNSLIKRFFTSEKLFPLNKIFKKHGLPNYSEYIDYKNSIAYVPTFHSMALHIKHNGQIKSNLIKMLKNLKYYNKNVFKHVFLKEEIYSGPFLDQAPDLLLISDRFKITSKLTKKLITKYKPGAYHHMNGVFIAYGSEIKQGIKVNSINIYDLAPTILHIFNLYIPSDMDGNVLKKIFKKNSELTKNEIKIDNSYGKIKEKIIDLLKFNKI